MVGARFLNTEVAFAAPPPPGGFRRHLRPFVVGGRELRDVVGVPSRYLWYPNKRFLQKELEKYLRAMK